MADLKIQYHEVSKLTPYVGNARTHSDRQIQQIAASIKEFGFVNPILLNGEGVVIAGHGRLMAAMSIGIKSVPCINIGYLSERQWKALVLADNRIAMNAGWDFEKLSDELSALADTDFDLDLIGFNEHELDGLLKGDKDILPEEFGEPQKIHVNGYDRTAVRDGLTDDDAVPEEPTVPVSIRGDVWLLGRHRLMCGDSTSKDDVSVLMDGQKADMVFTDIPYNAKFNGRSGDFEVIKNDNLPPDEFRLFVTSFAGLLKDMEISETYQCCDWRLYPHLYDLFGAKALIVWAKNVFGMGRGYRHQYELIVYNGKFDSTTESDLWNIAREPKKYVHPTQKPVDLPMRAITNSSAPGGTVLDFFGGSGSTLIACEKTDRTARVMELDPKYVDVIVKRWEEFTGQKAVHASNGYIFDQVAEERNS